LTSHRTPPSIDQISRGFSCPFEPFDEQFLNLLSVSHAKELVSKFVDRYGDRIRQRTSGLLSAIEKWLSKNPGRIVYEEVWDLAFGRLRTALGVSDSPDVVERAVSLALRMSECGHAAQWEARLERRARLRVGRCLLPPGRDFSVCAVRNRIDVQIRNRVVAPVSVRIGSGYHVDRQDVDLLAVAVSEKRKVIVLPNSALGATEFSDVRRRVDAHSPNSIVGPLQEALELIAEYSPNYEVWINRVIRQVVPLRDIPNVVVHSSDIWRPGVVYLANRRDLPTIAEILVHEASHQYMYILRRLGAIDDGSDRKSYFSPVRRVPRPIRAIVVAYHAIANVILFCRQCRSCRLLGVEEVERSLVSALGPLEKALNSTRALTPVGHALWRPLYDRLG
jgi:HEXXH motif-containing protein